MREDRAAAAAQNATQKADDDVDGAPQDDDELDEEVDVKDDGD